MASVDKTFEALLDDPEERVEGTKVLDVADRLHFSPTNCGSSCSTVCEIGPGLRSGISSMAVPAAPASAFVLVALAGRRPDARDPTLEDPGCRPASPEAPDSQRFIAAIRRRHRLPLAVGEAA